MSTDWTGLLPFLTLAGGGTHIFLVGGLWRRRPAGQQVGDPKAHEREPEGEHRERRDPTSAQRPDPPPSQ